MQIQAQEVKEILETFSDNVKFKYIEDFDISDLSLVYDLNIGTSNNTIDISNFSSVANLTVKLFNDSSLVLMTKGQEIISYFTNYEWLTIREMLFNSTVEIFYDNNLKVSQYTLLFSFYFNSEQTEFTPPPPVIINTPVPFIITESGLEIFNQSFTILNVETVNLIINII